MIAAAIAILLGLTSQQSQIVTICDPAIFISPQLGTFDQKYVAEVIDLGESIAGGGVNRYAQQVTLAPRRRLIGELPVQTVEASYFFTPNDPCAQTGEPRPKLGDMWIVYLSGDQVVAAVSLFWDRQTQAQYESLD